MNGDGKDKKGLHLSSSNWITIGVFIVSGIMAWTKIELHIADDTKHINPGEVALPIEEYKELLRINEAVINLTPTIQKNRNELIEIEIQDAVHFNQYETLLQEHNDLEDKVSRVYKELKDEIHQNQD